MSYTIMETHSPEFLEPAIRGRESLDDNKRLATHILDLCGDSGYRRVLVDVTALRESAGLPQGFALIQYLGDTGFAAKIDRLAMLHDIKRREVVPFLEIACQNRGVNVRAFESRAGAVAWPTDSSRSNISRAPAHPVS